jgi:hypothetical protein
MKGKFYILYDVLNDYTLEPVKGKSQYGELAHAKKRGVKDNNNKKVTWHLDSKWGGGQGRAWKGFNSARELIYIIVEHERVKNPCGTKKKRRKKRRNPIDAGDVRGHLVIAISPTGKKAAYLGSKKSARGDAFAMTKRTSALNFKSQAEAKAQLERYAPVLPRAFDNYDFAIIPAHMTTAQAVRKIRGKVKRRRNPVGPTQREIDSAASLFKDFSGDYPEHMTKVRLPNPKTGLVVGELDGVLYTTTRDGKQESYIHEFREKSRPHLVSSHDGSSLHILGGEYEFTERGIEDK